MGGTAFTGLWFECVQVLAFITFGDGALFFDVNNLAQTGVELASSGQTWFQSVLPSIT